MIPIPVKLSITNWLLSQTIANVRSAPMHEICCICHESFHAMSSDAQMLGYIYPPPVVQFAQCKHYIHYACIKKYLQTQYATRRRAMDARQEALLEQSTTLSTSVETSRQIGNELLSSAVAKHLLAFSLETSNDGANKSCMIEAVCPLCKASSFVLVYDDEYQATTTSSYANPSSLTPPTMPNVSEVNTTIPNTVSIAPSSSILPMDDINDTVENNLLGSSSTPSYVTILPPWQQQRQPLHTGFVPSSQSSSSLSSTVSTILTQSSITSSSSNTTPLQQSSVSDDSEINVSAPTDTTSSEEQTEPFVMHREELTDILKSLIDLSVRLSNYLNTTTTVKKL